MAGTEPPSRFVWSPDAAEVHAATEQTRRTAGPSAPCLTRAWRRFVCHRRANVLNGEKTTALRFTLLTHSASTARPHPVLFELITS